MKNAIARFLRKVGITLSVLVCISYALILMYALPRTVVVAITGTEVKRGIGGVGGDVRYVLAEGPEGEPYVFRNEDTGWGFPPYFKFDSGTLAAKATNLAKENDAAPVLLKYYGFRIPLISAFPNVVNMRVVDKDYEHLPLFNIIFLTVNTILFVYLGIRFALWRRRRRKRAANLTAASEAA
jgi:hypothetical protein